MGLPNVRHTGCEGLGPQLVVLELIQVSLHEATGLDGLERHEDAEMCRGGRGERIADARRERGGVCKAVTGDADDDVT